MNNIYNRLLRIYYEYKEMTYEQMVKDYNEKKVKPKNTLDFEKQYSREMIIVALSLGYVNDRKYTSSKIAEFLEMNEEDVREFIKNYLLNQKEQLIWQSRKR